MVGSFVTRIAVSSVLILVIFGPQAHAIKSTSIVGTDTVLSTTHRMPATCNCAKSITETQGTCYYKPDKNSNKCKARSCEASFECKPGASTGTICIRKKTTKKMVMKYPGHCEDKPISGYQYVPYKTGPSGPTISSGGSGSTRGLPGFGTEPASRKPSPSPKPPSPAPQPVVLPTKNKRGFYMVVADKKVIYKTKRLNDAKKALNKIKGGSRCIFQVKDGKVLFDPHRISGYPQTPKYGFHTFWWNWPDLRRMHNVAEQHYRKLTHKPKPSPKPKFIKTENRKGIFIIVRKNKVVYAARSLNKAKKHLRKYKKGSRCMFQVKRGKVLADPHHIAGYPQTRQYGFRRSWKSWKDISRMHAIAQKYYEDVTRPKPSKSPRPSPSKSPRPSPSSKPVVIKTKNVKGEYYIIAGNHMAAKATNLDKAKNYLRRIKRGSRCIFQVKNYRIVPNPRKIADYPQSTKYGFQRKWRNKDDIRRMYKVAVKNHRYPTQNVKGIYLVVVGNKVIRKTLGLIEAKRYLRKYKKGSRCIFQVKNRKVVRNPRKIAGYPQIRPFGFNAKWKGKKDIRRMRAIASKYYKDFIKPKLIRTDNIKGTYIIVANGRAVGMRRWLNNAKNLLAKQNAGSRCIFAANKCKLIPRVSKIAGYRQNKLHGFNSSWKDGKDVSNMRIIAFKYLKWSKYCLPKTDNKKGNYIIVAKNKVVDQVRWLNQAKKELAKHKSGSRCIFEADKCKVIPRAGKIATYPQTPYYGFNKSWKNVDDVRGMLKIARKYLKGTKACKPKIKRTDNVKGTYVIVVGDKIVKRVRWLDQAKATLKKYKRGSRCIFQMKAGKALNPAKIADYPQHPRYGFNRKWKNADDIRRMYKIAGRMYVVVYAKKAIGNYVSLEKAKDRLSGVKPSSRTPRAIFRVRNGKISKKPFMVGNKYFRTKSQFRKMWNIADEYVKGL